MIILQARQGGQLCERDTCSDDSIKVENKFRFEDQILDIRFCHTRPWIVGR